MPDGGNDRGKEVTELLGSKAAGRARSEQNLIKTNKITPEVHAKLIEKASATHRETTQRKKHIKEVIDLFLEMKVDGNVRERLEQMGIHNPDDMTYATAIVVAQGIKAINGDTKAAEFLVTNSGQDPKYLLEREKIEVARQLAAKPVQDGTPESDVVIYLPAIDEEEKPKDKPEETEVQLPDADKRDGNDT
ncbi:MAG: hypothetical protein LUD47_07730 [Clostridia bacterium]|nr:hypothetical protein [Clostridia bacterium]